MQDGAGHVGWGGSCRGGVGHAGWGGSYRGGLSHAGVGWVMQGWVTEGWDESCRGGVGHTGVGWIIQWWGGSCRGWVCKISLNNLICHKLGKLSHEPATLLYPCMTDATPATPT